MSFISIFNDFFKTDEVSSITSTRNPDGTFNLVIKFYCDIPGKSMYVYQNLTKQQVVRASIDLRNQLL